MDLLMIVSHITLSHIKSYYVYIKDFNRFMCNKIKCKNKENFCRYCLQCFSSERVLTEHKGVKSSSDRGDNTSYTEKYQDHIPWSFSYQLVCIDNNFSKPIVLFRGKDAV